ncbi:MAG: TonB-dependent receptor [Caulobacterales bacterium]|nr:TonB-dependent receptor [Caulobacterales bacterium]
MFRVHIAAGPASESLKTLARATRHSVLFDLDVVEEVETNAVSGDYTLSKALELLLEGTVLTGGLTDRGVIRIARAAPQGPAGENDMNNNRARRASLFAGVSALVTGVLAWEPALAQEPAAVDDTEVIVVTGFRGSLETALEAKRDADSIVDSISSEGIGRFPDLNLGESLQRVTGVQIERGERRRAEIAIRGLPRKFALTRVNGQAMASPDLRNAFAFGVFESSIFNGADVIKTPTVDMDDGGLSGIVDVKTLRPFDASEDGVSFTTGVNYETLADKVSPIARARGNMQFSDTLAGAFSVAWSDQRFRRDVAAVTDYDPDANDIQVADDFRYRADTTEGDRISASGALQWRPRGDLDFGLTGVYTEYDQLTVRDQVRIRNCADTAVEVVGVSAVTSTHTGCRYEIETRERKDFDSTWAVTLDGAWESDGWLAEGAVHYTRGRHDGNLIQLRRRINGAPGVVTVNTGAGDPEDFAISVEGFATGDLATWSFDDPDVQTRFFPTGANNENTDTELAIQADVTRSVNLGLLESVKAGVKYRDRGQESIDQDAVNDDVDLDALNDSIFRQSLVADTNFFGGNLSTFPLIVPDVFAGLDLLLPVVTDQPVNDEGFVTDQDFLATFDTKQEITAGYVMANFNSAPLDFPVRVYGNAGVRVVRTDRSTDTFQEIDGEISTISVPFDFTNVLPAANIVFELREDLLLRGSYSETIVRPNPGDFRAGIEVEVNEDAGMLESVNVTYNNPELEPFEADSIDVSLEWYNRPGSAFTGAFFRKKVASDIITREFCPTSLADFGRADPFASFVTGQLNGDLNDCMDDAGVSFNITDVVNSSETFTINGFEFGLLQNFDFLPAPFDGFGVQANYTYIDTDEGSQLDEDGNPAPLEEISEHTVNFIGYYETDLWGVRLAHNYRSEYFTLSDRGPSGGNRSIDGRHQLDLSLNVSATDQLSFGFEALNLNNAQVFEFEGDRNRLRNYSYDGRTFVLLATYDF